MAGLDEPSARQLVKRFLGLTWWRAAARPPWPPAEIVADLASTVASMSEHGS